MIQRSLVNNFQKVTSKTKLYKSAFSVIITEYYLLLIAKLFDFISVFVKTTDLLFKNFEKIK